jgi:predicted SAM-dependent methyltransferase
VTPKVKAYVKNLGLAGKCLDVGAYNVNGSVKDLFQDYTGLDMRQGPNVDVVAQATRIPFPDNTFEVVTCLEMLEHAEYPVDCIREMLRVLKHGGYIVITIPGISFPKHDYPSDYWRVTAEGLGVWLKGLEGVSIQADHDHVYGVARKP